MASRSSSDAGAAPPREWWASQFDARYVREHTPLFREEHDRRAVRRLVELLGLPLDARVLDLACGQGRHARLLAEAGYRVVGLDASRYLLRAATRVPSRRLRFQLGDMRHLPARWSGAFDAVVNLWTSFGFFFDPWDDHRVVREVARVLAPGGTFLWHGASRDGVMARFLSRDWWDSGSTLVAHEREFDPLSGILTVRSRLGPDATERAHRIRLYTATRLAELCADAGLLVEEAYDGWRPRPLTRRSSEMVLVARKRELPSGRARG